MAQVTVHVSGCDWQEYKRRMAAVRLEAQKTASAIASNEAQQTAKKLAKKVNRKKPAE